MAGTYAHFMVAEKAREKLRTDSDVKKVEVLFSHWPFVIAGAVAPDFPYLVLPSEDAKHWANRMHHWRTKETVCAGIDSLRANHSDEALAWMLGYLSHVVTDVVIHPVVNLIVGPYVENKKDHRLCEMTQDSYIFKKIKDPLEINNAEYIDLLRQISSTENKNAVHPDVERLWWRMFEVAHGDLLAKSPPTINRWYSVYMSALDTVDERIVFSRHIREFAEESAVFYRRSDEIPPDDFKKFINDLPTPGNGRINYNELFNKTTEKVIEAWRGMLLDLQNVKTGWTSEWIKEWSLDTGLEINETPYFWA